jgi:type 1 glutamine amidotransferase/sugar phosphate isomerase/epimerase
MGRSQTGGPPSVSVRSTGPTIRASATSLLGWRVGLPANAFQQLTFSEAAGKVDAVGVAYIEGFSGQKVSPEMQKSLDYNLSPDELAKVKYRLGELRLRMPAYHTDTLPTDASSRRKLFEFAKSLGVEMIVSGSEPASLADLDQLANEFGVNVALENLSPKSVAATLQGRSQRIGVVADLGKWMEAGIKPLEGLPLVKDRLMAVNLRDRSAVGATGRSVTLGSGTAGVTQFLLEMSKLQPPAAPQPPKCSIRNAPEQRVAKGESIYLVDCVNPGIEGRPLFLSVDTTGAADTFADLSRSVEAFEMAVRPAMGYRVDEISRKTPITTADRVTPEERQKIEAALPRQAIVKPLKPRKLLVLDLCPAGGYYHATIAHGALALELMGRYTGAYEPVFSNDLDNLKYPKIRQFDAVFLNDTVGELLPDPDVLNGLLRFVREGGGLAGLHGATYTSLNLREFGEMIGAGDGPHRVEPATLKIDDPSSPLTMVFGGKAFAYTEEYYRYYDSGPTNLYSREKVHVLLSIDMAKSPAFNQERPPYIRKDNDYAVSYIKSYGKGRVFNCSLGHTPALFATPALAEHILAAIQFVLGDLKADTTPSVKLVAKQ